MDYPTDAFPLVRRHDGGFIAGRELVYGQGSFRPVEWAVDHFAPNLGSYLVFPNQSKALAHAKQWCRRENGRIQP